MTQCDSFMTWLAGFEIFDRFTIDSFQINHLALNDEQEST